MEIALVTFGGILLLIGVGGGALMGAKVIRSDGDLRARDRVGASLIGIALIATAVVLRIDAPTVSLLSTFGVTAALTLLYALCVAVGRPR